MSEDDIEETQGTETSGVKHKYPGFAETHKEEELEDHLADCYWCGRVFEKSKMRTEKRHSTVIYICKDC